MNTPGDINLINFMYNMVLSHIMLKTCVSNIIFLVGARLHSKFIKVLTLEKPQFLGY